MSYFYDRQFGPAENIFYKGWLLDSDPILSDADYSIYVDDFDFSVDGLELNFTIDGQKSSDSNAVIAARYTVEHYPFGFSVFRDSFEFEVVRLAESVKAFVDVKYEVDYLGFDFDMASEDFDLDISFNTFDFEVMG